MIIKLVLACSHPNPPQYGLRFYFLSLLKIKTGLWIIKIYGFEFGEVKTRLCSAPIIMPNFEIFFPVKEYSTPSSMIKYKQKNSIF
jgi:hypothetical protein